MTDTTIEKLLKKYEFNISEEKIKKLNDYVNLLFEENKKYNLASIKNEEEFLEKNLIDSLIILKTDIKLEGKLIDIGSGNGFPAIILKIVFDDLKVTVLDSNGKKIKFLNLVNDKMDLKLNVIYDRSENITRNNPEKYDFVSAKALVSDSLKWLKWTTPFLKKGGISINYRTEKFVEEIKNDKKIINYMKKKGIKLKLNYEYFIKNIKRNLIFLEKIN